jgi:hypothetical protein
MKTSLKVQSWRAALALGATLVVFGFFVTPRIGDAASVPSLLAASSFGNCGECITECPGSHHAVTYSTTDPNPVAGRHECGGEGGDCSVHGSCPASKIDSPELKKLYYVVQNSKLEDLTEALKAFGPTVRINLQRHAVQLDGCLPGSVALSIPIAE